MSEINKREILELMKLEGNNKCADCGKKGEQVLKSIFNTIIKMRFSALRIYRSGLGRCHVRNIRVLGLQWNSSQPRRSHI